MAAHGRPSEQSIFPIVQGGLDPVLRTESAKQLIQRKVNGYAIGGLRYLCNKSTNFSKASFSNYKL